MNRFALAAVTLFANTRVGNALEALFNRYEGAQPSGPDRSYLPALVRDARFDATSYTRWELFRKIGYFERNVYLVGRLRDEFVKWSVGPNGLQVIPASTDHEWNKRMLESYLEWCESPFLDSTITMAQGHRLMASEEHIYGELFVNTTRWKDAGKPSRPAVQFIESHRCSDPGMEFSWPSSGQDRIDGVQLGRDAITNRPCKPAGYWVRDGFDGVEWVFRSTADMLHVHDPKRIGMYRAVTPYHSVLNTLHDLDDLEIYEMQRAKKNASVANIIENASGELNPEQLRAARYGSRSLAAATGTEADKARAELYQKILGSRTIALKTGEKFIELDSKNPSAATQWYWRYKIGQVAAAANVPLILAFPEIIETMQGTVVRGIYDNAHQFFRSKYFVFAHAARFMFRFYANWARYNDPRCFDAPADWKTCTVIPPRAVNVDIGRNSAARLAEYAAGTTSLDDIAGAEGTTGDVLSYKKARGVGRVKQIAAEVSKQMGVEVKPEEIMGPLADIAQKLALAEGNNEGENVEDPKEEVEA